MVSHEYCTDVEMSNIFEELRTVILFVRFHLHGRKSACPQLATGAFLFLTDRLNSPISSYYSNFSIS